MRRAAFWLVLIGSALIVIGVLIQAFSIVAHVRGAGPAALDIHGSNSLTVHLGQLMIVVGAIWGWWGNWKAVALAIVFLVVSLLQILFTPGDTDTGWIYGLHGLLAIVVLLGAVAYGQVAFLRLGLGQRRRAA